MSISDGVGIEVRNLRVVYGGFVAVADTSLRVRASESFGIVGESGSGKSTVLRAICGLAPCQSGTVRLLGQSAGPLPQPGSKPFRRLVQMVFQDPYRSARMNSSMPLKSNRVRPTAVSRMIELVTPRTPSELEAVRRMLVEYALTLGVDLCFQDFEAELAALPGPYAEPRGALLTAFADGALVGCCALRPLDTVDYANACEMKRLYVRPQLRGLGIGRLLAEAILDSARRAGYTNMLLDTLSDMETARALYQDLGFEEIPPYYHNPIPGSHYLRVRL